MQSITSANVHRRPNSVKRVRSSNIADGQPHWIWDNWQEQWTSIKFVDISQIAFQVYSIIYLYYCVYVTSTWHISISFAEPLLCVRVSCDHIHSLCIIVKRFTYIETIPNPQTFQYIYMYVLYSIFTNTVCIKSSAPVIISSESLNYGMSIKGLHCVVCVSLLNIIPYSLLALYATHHTWMRALTSRRTPHITTNKTIWIWRTTDAIRERH